jgi:hypothetical protein
MRRWKIAVPLVAAAFVFLYWQPVEAAGLFFAANGTGSTCSQSTPCLLAAAISQASTTPVELSCADSGDISSGATINKSLTIDCAGTAGSISGIEVNSGAVVTLKNFTMGGNTDNGIYFLGGTLILENIHFIGAIVNEINALPSTPSTLIVRNCVFDHGGAAIVLKPSAGGSLSVQFDHVTVVGNTGGGIRADSSNGPISVDITDSLIADNAANGLNITSGSGTQNNMVNIIRTTIAKNGAVGIQTGGSNAAVLLNASTLDSNTSGATLVVNGGHIVSYGNNQIIGTLGSGFTGSASLQ